MIESPERVTTVVPALARPGVAKTKRPKLIAVMPAFNEAETIAGVLERLYPLVDRMLVVDDGSTDNNREGVFSWLVDKPHAHLVAVNRNRGMSAADYAAVQPLPQ